MWRDEPEMNRPQIVAVLGEGATEDIRLASKADMIELRLDLIRDPLPAARAIRQATGKPIIATNRLRDEGGRFLGSERERIEILARASEYADFIDIELQAERREEIISRVSRPAILSYHDFQGMPKIDEIALILERMRAAGAAIAKIAVTPGSLKDGLDLLGFLLSADMPVSLVAMGDLGRHLRAVAPLYGSALVYAYVIESTAPGQMSLEELSAARELLKW